MDDKNFKDVYRPGDKPPPIDREGVAYIPSGQAMPPPPKFAGETKKINMATPPMPSRPAVAPGPKAGSAAVPLRRGPAKPSNYAIVLIATVVVGAIAAVFVFITMLNSVFNNNTVEGGGGGGGNFASPPPNGGQNEAAPPIVSPPAAENSITGLIRHIGNNRLDIYIFETSEIRSLFVERHSDLRDRFGNAITLPQFSIGDLVEIVHAPGSNSVDSAQLSAQIRILRDYTDVVVDGQTLSIGNRHFQLGDNPIILYRGNPTDITIIDPVDVVTVGIFQETFVTSIDIQRSHGEITIPLNEEIEGGTVEIGSIFRGLDAEGDMTLRVPTGENMVVVRGTNIEPFIFNTNVARGSTSTLNFNGLEFRSGSLIVRTEVGDAIMHITSGEEERWEPVNEEISLDFGIHTIRIEAPGYHTFETTVDITATPREINANLEAITIVETRNVTIATSPSEARIYLDGVFRGVTPLHIDLETRRHTLTIERAGSITTNTNIHVTADDSAFFTFILTPDPAWAAP